MWFSPGKLGALGFVTEHSFGPCCFETISYVEEDCSGQSPLTLAGRPASCTVRGSVWKRDDPIGRGTYRCASPQRQKERTQQVARELRAVTRT